MSTLVIVLRAASLLAFAAPLLLSDDGSGGKHSSQVDQSRGERTPVLAHFAAFGLFLIFLTSFARSAGRRKDCSRKRLANATPFTKSKPK